ncbi:MAG: hypothetical protein AB2L14_09275 [Candidatus Xenobiia bacterium LiM19]
MDLQAQVKGPEVIQAHNRELYIVFHDGIASSRLTNSLIDLEAWIKPVGNLTLQNWK